MFFFPSTACTCEHISIIEALVRNGADVKAVDADGNTPANNTYSKDIHELLTKFANARWYLNSCSPPMTGHTCHKL